MTEQEAQALAQRIRQEEGERVTVKSVTVKNGGKLVTGLNLMLKAGQRSMRIVKVDEWESLKAAWEQIL